MDKGGQQNSYEIFLPKRFTKREYIKRMMKIWREIRVSETTEQKLADQTRVIIKNGWLFEVKLDETQRKINEEENMEEPRIELQKHV